MAKLFDKLKEKSQEVAKAAKEKGQVIAQAAREKHDAVFKSSKEINGDLLLIPCIAEQITKEFKAEGYEVDCKKIENHYDISLTNGGLVKSAVGLKTALKINIYPNNGNIHINAGVGVFGQQALPTAVTALVAWPVAATQIWGLVKQSKLDDKAVAIAEKVVATDKIVTLLDGTRIPKSKVPYDEIYINEAGQKVRKVMKIVEKPKEEDDRLISKIADFAETASDKVTDVAQKTWESTKDAASQAGEWTKQTAQKTSELARQTVQDASEWVQENEAIQNALQKGKQAYLFVSDKTTTAVQVVGNKFVELKNDEQVIAAWQKTGEIAGKVGQTSLKGLKVISGVQAVQDRKKSIKTKEEAEKLQEEVMATNEAVRDDLNDALETFGKRRLDALHNTVGVFLDYLDRLNQKSKAKEYEFLTEIDIKTEEVAEMKQIDMKASDAAKVLAVGGGFAAIGLAGTPFLVTTLVTSFAAASTGTAISTLSGAAATNAVLAWLGGGAIAAGGGGVAAGTAVMTALTATATAGLAVIAVGTLASAFYSRKYTEATKHLAEVQEWVAQTEASWTVMAGIKQRVLELQGLTEDLETRTIAQLHKLDPYIDNFNNTDMTQVGLFQQAAIMVKSMSELAQVPILDEDGNLNEQANIVAAKTEKVLNTSL